MSSSNRTQVLTVRESTLGTTPGTPRMRTLRLTGESLSYQPIYVDSDEIRADRMMGDPILAMTESQGGINFEVSYPDDNSPLSDLYRSAFYNTWVNTPQRDNDGTADSVITGIATAGEVATVVTASDAFVASQLVKFSGFTVAGNNGVFKCTTGSATVPAFVGSGITDEAAPPAAAKMKVVGFIGAAGDITAAAGGLASTLLDFTTLGLAVGQWIKIGGTAAGDKFANIAVDNGWARITAIAANALTLDNKPTGWDADNGATKTIKVWFGDQIKNGTTQTSLSIEKGFLDQTTPTYIINTGMVVDTMSHNMASRAKIGGSVAFKGMGGSAGTTALDASPDAVTTGLVMAANANVGRLGIDGTALISPNWGKSIEFTINNNNRVLDSIDSQSPVGVNMGECLVTGKFETYFGSLGELTKLYNNTATAINARVTKNSQALIFQIPRAQYRGGGNPAASGKNVDVMVTMDFQASEDTTTSAHVLLDRVPYFEA